MSGPSHGGGMRHLDLFSGIGGFALAARWAGFTTVGFCEIDPFYQKVLAKNFPGVPIHDDIRTLTASALAYAQGKGLPQRQRAVGGNTSGPGPERGDRAGVDLITGGFPCQPFSVAGGRRGAADDRHLWPEMARVVAEVRPRWVVGENVAGFVNMALDDCLADLEALGYEARAVVVPACAVGAPHRRDRVWIVAHAERLQGGERDEVDLLRGRAEQAEQTGLGGGGVALADAQILSEREPANEADALAGSRDARQEPGGGGWWAVEPPVGRVAHGVPGRVDRLKSLGNAIVPQVAYVILSEIARMEAA